MRRAKDAEAALVTIVGDEDIAARIRCLLPALQALVEGRRPTWLHVHASDSVPTEAKRPGPLADQFTPVVCPQTSGF